MRLEKGTVLVCKGSRPQLVEVMDIFEEGDPPTQLVFYEIEFDSDGSIHDNHLSEVEDQFEIFQPKMVVYCWTGKSRFCQSYKSGYYQINNDLNMVRYSDRIISSYLGLHLPGNSQEEFARAIQLKAFW